jgi:hypothetical protein
MARAPPRRLERPARPVYDPLVHAPVLVRRLTLVSAALLVYWLLTFALAVTQDWPAEFGAGPEDRPETLGEWIWRGSLLHAPLAPILGQLVFTGIVLRPTRTSRSIGGLGLAAVGTLFTIGGLGEPLRPQLSDPPLPLYVGLRVLGLAGSVALVVFGVRVALAARRGDDR